MSQLGVRSMRSWSGWIRYLRGAALAALTLSAGCGEKKTVPDAAGAASPNATAPDMPASDTPTPTKAKILPEGGPREAEYPALHNLLQISDRVYSGAEPQGDDAFAALKALGIKTVVSVDGIRPDLETAAKYGLRYVHIPVGYDGIEAEAAAQLARVADEVEGPIYFHCHHGRHRGPAAAAAACVAMGDATGQEALRILEVAGTSRNYPGLWRSVEQYRRPPEGTLLPALVAEAKLESLTAAMAQIDRRFDLLELSAEHDFRLPPEHPDLVPHDEAVLLREAFRESARGLSEEYDQDFRRQLSAAESAAAALQAALVTGNLEEATRQMKMLDAGCKACHQQYRDGAKP
jgi:protein tyrosine phosphatase (PTP) superfamily phosphohydrolase (DUF442 family)